MTEIEHESSGVVCLCAEVLLGERGVALHEGGRDALGALVVQSECVETRGVEHEALYVLIQPVVPHSIRAQHHTRRALCQTITIIIVTIIALQGAEEIGQVDALDLRQMCHSYCTI